MSGFSYPLPTFNSSVYNPAFYLSLDSTGYLTYDYAQTLYLSKNDFRLTYITGITPGVVQAGTALVLDNSLSLTGLGSISCSSLTVAGSPVATAPDYVLSITPGTASASKALVLDDNRRISGIQSLCIGSSSDTARQLSILKNDLAVGGQLFSFCYGVNAALNDQSEFCFGYAGPESADNSLSLGFYANPNIFRVEASQSVDVPFHNGTTKGLKLGGILITASASEINYVDVVAGAAAASKALVLNSSRDISNINELTAAKLSGTLQTASQPLITSLGAQTTINSAEYRLNGSIIDFDSFTAESPYLSGIVVGEASSSKALVVNADKDISSIRNLTAVNLAGVIQTTSQPLITSLGTLTSLNSIEYRLNGSLIDFDSFTAESAYLSGVSPGTGQASKALILNASRDIMNINELTSNVVNGALFRCSNLNPASRSTIDFTNNIRTIEVGLRGSAMDNPDTFYIYGSGSYNLTIDSSGNTTIGGVESAGYRLNIIGSCNASSLSIGGTLITATAAKLNYLDITTIGTVEASKALVVNSNRDIININSLSASQLTGTLQTAAQPQITSVGTLSSLTITNGLTASTLTGTLQTAAQPQITSLGTLSSLTITNGLTASTLTGTLQTAAQPQITSVGTLSSLTVSGALTVGSVNIGTTIGSLTGITAGTALASKALVLNATKDIAGINSISTTKLITNSTSIATIENGSAAGLYDLLLWRNNIGNGVSHGIAFMHTSNDPSTNTPGASILYERVDLSNGHLKLLTGGVERFRISSAGNIGINNSNPLYRLDVSGSANINGALSLAGTAITATATKLNYTDITTIGTAEASKALVLNATSDISGINSLSALNLTGTLQTAAQPQITSVGTLTSLSTGTITLDNVLITSTADELNYVDVSPGVSTASKALVMNASNKIGSIGELGFSALSSVYKTILRGSTIDGSAGIELYSTETQTPSRKPMLNFKSSNDDAPIFTRMSGYLNDNDGTWNSNGCPFDIAFKGSNSSDSGLRIGCINSTQASNNNGNIGLYARNHSIAHFIASDRFNQSFIKPTTSMLNSQISGFGVLMGENTLMNAGAEIRGNATILKLRNSGGGSADRTSFEITHNVSWECSLGGSTHAVAPNSLYWYQSGYKLCLSPLGNGRLGIGTGSPFCPLVVNGFENLTITSVAVNTMVYNISNDTHSYMGPGPLQYGISAYFSSNIHVQNSIFCSSDRRLKENIKDLDVSEEHFLKLEPKSYNYRNDDKTKLGLIAQSVMELCFESIMMTPNENLKVEAEGDLEKVQLNIDYQAILMMTVSIVKKLINRIDKLEKKKNR